MRLADEALEGGHARAAPRALPETAEAARELRGADRGAAGRALLGDVAAEWWALRHGPPRGGAGAARACLLAGRDASARGGGPRPEVVLLRGPPPPVRRSAPSGPVCQPTLLCPPAVRSRAVELLNP